MKEVTGTITEKGIEIVLSGRIDSNNARDAENEIASIVEGKNDLPTVIDAQDLVYISSAGLRVLLHLKKTNADLKIINVNSDVYEIFDIQRK